MNGKYRFTITMVIFLLILNTSFVLATSEKEKVRVGYWPSYGISVTKDGQLYGYTYDYMNEIAKINNWKLEYIPCGWSQGIEMLKEGKIDIFGALQKDEEREEYYDYTNLNFGYEYGALYVNSKNNTISYNNLKEIDGKVVGTVSDNHFKSVFDEYCKKNKISVKYKYIEGAEELQKELEKGTIDMILTGSIRDIPNTKVVLRFSSEPIYYATTKGNKKILDGLNYALNEIKREDIYYDGNLFNKHYKSTAIATEVFTLEEKEYIKKHPVIKVVSGPDTSPLSFYDKNTNSYKGISIDILKSISNNSGLKFEYIKVDNFSEGLKMVENGEVDICANMFMSRSTELEHNIIFTDGYLETTMLGLAKNDIRMDEKTKVAMIKWTGIESFVKEYYPNQEVSFYPNASKCIEAVKKEESDVFIGSNYILNNIINTEESDGLMFMPIKNQVVDIGIGVSEKANPALLSILNKSINRVTEEEVAIAVTGSTKYLEHTVTLLDFIQHNIMAFILIILFIIFIVFGIFIVNYKVQMNKLKKIAYVDEVTGIRSLLKFKIDANKLFEKYGTYNFVIYYINIDKFKYINDMFGFEFGDNILKYIARKIGESIFKDEIYARLSDDRFIVMTKKSNIENLRKRANDFFEIVNSDKENTFKIDIILKCGAYLIDKDDVNIDVMIDRAKIACQTIETNYKSKVAFYDDKIRLSILREKEIENNMDNALLNKEFVIYLQPKINLITDEIVGSEALVRWIHPIKGTISPNDFIPLFEKNGFIEKLDLYVWDNVFSTMSKWIKNGIKPPPISINVSRIHLNNRNIVTSLKSLINKHNIPAHLIELELTESLFLSNISMLLDILNDLHDIGFIVSMDDFGSGYSSLSLLKKLPIDVLKIDREFLNETITSTRGEKVIKNIITLGKDLDMLIVAEGIETEGQLNLLKNAGCDIGQGFYFARPMDIESFEKLVFKRTDF
ncbi:EAL domain-containing protein [Clostridioides sp. ES-S-0048-02]|uniref:EAL domain-containing protein n=2 Tax=Clostridioides TaxID=1870884 RepID=UPI001D0FEAEE|nr:EAL domain-containing protein [Clostridioides sp. ES-S-0048-02]